MCQMIPRPGPEQTALLDALGVQLHEALPRRKAVAATRHKLPARRKRQLTPQTIQINSTLPTDWNIRLSLSV
jgi:hypothetical protein